MREALGCGFEVFGRFLVCVGFLCLCETRFGFCACALSVLVLLGGSFEAICCACGMLGVLSEVCSCLAERVFFSATLGAEGIECGRGPFKGLL